VNAQARKPAPKKPAAKKAVKKPVVAKKPVAKKAAPAKKAVVKKPVVKKPAAKPVAKSAAKSAAKTAAKKPVKAVAKKVTKPVAKKAAPSKVTAKKVVAKKPTPVKAKPAAKPVAKKVPAKAVKPVVKAAAKPVAKAAKPAPKAAAKVADKKPVKETKAKEAKVVAPAPVVHTTPIIPGYTPVVHKKNSRAAKMAALVPPPPAQVVASTAAKSSFMPMAAPAVSTIVPVIPKKDAKLANNWKTKTADQLTDAEVIAMPDSEYMNDIQMAFFRLKLVQLKNEVLSNASETTEHLREDTVVVPDPADRATIEEEHALELRTRDRERKLLKKIEQSINRIDAGDYGYCDETGEAIGVGRLLARPTATLSLEAQERRELKQKMFGD
jgi:DnaK suppressor protein